MNNFVEYIVGTILALAIGLAVLQGVVIRPLMQLVDQTAERIVNLR